MLRDGRELALTSSHLREKAERYDSRRRSETESPRMTRNCRREPSRCPPPSCRPLLQSFSPSDPPHTPQPTVSAECRGGSPSSQRTSSLTASQRAAQEAECRRPLPSALSAAARGTSPTQPTQQKQQQPIQSYQRRKRREISQLQCRSPSREDRQSSSVIRLSSAAEEEQRQIPLQLQSSSRYAP